MGETQETKAKQKQKSEVQTKNNARKHTTGRWNRKKQEHKGKTEQAHKERGEGKDLKTRRVINW